MTSSSSLTRITHIFSGHFEVPSQALSMSDGVGRSYSAGPMDSLLTCLICHRAKSRRADRATMK
jgi:hypothetical protein